MASSKTRKLSLSDDDLPESSMQPRSTRPRLELELEPLGFGIQPPVNINQDLHNETDLTMYIYLRPPSQEPQEPQPQPPPQIVPPVMNIDQDTIRQTELTMYFYVQEPQPQPQLPQQQQQQPQQPQQPQQVVAKAQAQTQAPRKARKKPTHAPRQGKSTTIDPPFAWAKDLRAQVHSMKYLQEHGINTIIGDVECKRCQKTYQIEYNLEEKFKQVSEYVTQHRFDFYDRAPPEWMTPILPKCKFCYQENSMKPVLNKKKSINWLFLLLGQMLGCCTLEQLKYFCKHTGNHRTGAKDRVLFLTYLGVCKQVNPDGPFDHQLDHKGRNTKKQSIR